MATKLPKINIQIGEKVELNNMINEAVNNANAQIAKMDAANHGGLADPKTMAREGQSTTEEVFFDIDSKTIMEQNEKSNISSQTFETNINQGNNIGQKNIDETGFELKGQRTSIKSNSYSNNEQTSINTQSFNNDTSNTPIANQVKETVKSEEEGKGKSGEELQSRMMGTTQNGSNQGLNGGPNTNDINIGNATGNEKKETGIKNSDITIKTTVSGENKSIEDNHDIASIYSDDDYEQMVSECTEVLNEQLQFYKDALAETEKRELEVKKAIAEMAGMTYEEALAENKTEIYEESYQEEIRKQQEEIENDKLIIKAAINEIEKEIEKAPYLLLVNTEEYANYEFDEEKLREEIKKTAEKNEGVWAANSDRPSPSREKIGNSIQINEAEKRLESIMSENPELVKIYYYEKETKGEEAALKCFEAIEEEVSKIEGQKQAEEFIESLANEEDIKGAIANHLKVSKKGLEGGGESFASGIKYSVEALFGEENRKYSAEEYEKMYILQSLINGEYDGLFLENNYEISQSIGNMAPSIAISIVSSSLGLPELGIVSMGVSAGGNSYHSAMVEGNDKDKAILYGVLSGVSEATLEKLIGGIPGLSEVNVTSLKTFGRAMVNEGIEEGTQEYIDALLQAGILDEQTTIEEVNKNALKSAIYGMITAGILNGPTVSLNSLSNTQTTNYDDALSLLNDISEQSDYTGLKRLKETIDNIYESSDEKTQDLLNNTLSILNQNYNLKLTENSTDSLKINDLLINLNNTLHTTRETTSHELGHFIADITIDSNLSDYNKQIIDNLNRNNVQINNFLIQAGNYIRTLNNKALQQAQAYLDTHPEENFDEVYQEIFESQRMFDHEAQIYDLITGIIDSVYAGNNPYYNLYTAYNLRGHDSNYYNQENISIKEQFADYFSYRANPITYDAATNLINSLLGEEWLTNMDNLFNQALNKTNNLDISNTLGENQEFDYKYQVAQKSISFLHVLNSIETMYKNQGINNIEQYILTKNPKFITRYNNARTIIQQIPYNALIGNLNKVINETKAHQSIKIDNNISLYKAKELLPKLYDIKNTKAYKQYMNYVNKCKANNDVYFFNYKYLELENQINQVRNIINKHKKYFSLKSIGDIKNYYGTLSQKQYSQLLRPIFERFGSLNNGGNFPYAEYFQCKDDNIIDYILSNQSLNFYSKNQLLKYLNETHQGQILSTLTVNEVLSLYEYTSGNGFILRYLTDPQKQIKSDFRIKDRVRLDNIIQGIDSAIVKSGGTKDNMILYRGDEFWLLNLWKAWNVSSYYDLLPYVGKTVKCETFMSTGVSKNTSFNRPVLWIIKAPIGTKGIYVNDVSEYFKDDIEYEYIIDRNSYFRIDGVTYDPYSSKVIISAKIVKQ